MGVSFGTVKHQVSPKVQSQGDQEYRVPCIKVEFSHDKKNVEWFQSWFVGHNRREANKTVLGLANIAIHQSLEQVRMEECHILIQIFVLAEHNVSYWIKWKLWSFLHKKKKTKISYKAI
jgi:hypothetical protein